MVNANTLGGVFTAMITPMKEDGAVDYEGFRRLIRLQIEAGVSGLVPVATTGEAPTLDDAEWDELVKITVKETKAKPVLVMPGTGSNSTKHTVERTARAKELGAGAALVVTPYYNRPNDEGIEAHFRAAAAVGLPVVVYNVPGRTARNIDVSLMEKLARISGIVGVKEASGSISQIADILFTAAAGSKTNGFAVLSGDDGLTLPAMALGACGVVSVVSNLVPEKIVALVKACRSGHFDAARVIHYVLLPLFKAAFLESNPIPIKRAMTLAGLPAGPTRLPLGYLSPDTETRLRQELTRLRI
jgi:4-hydroxy-tetrahydrodipicolinate synthase